MEWDRIAHVAALAAVVALAGCAGLGGGEQSVDETVTAAPVPTDAAEFPPGVTGGDVAAEVVAEAHERRMNGTNYTVVSRRRVVGRNGTVWVTNRTRKVAEERGTYWGRIDRRADEPPLGRLVTPVEYWGNESVFASQRILTAETQFYGWARTGRTGEFTSLPLVGDALAATRLSVVDRPDGVVLVGQSLRDPSRLPSPSYFRDPRNVSVTVRVSNDGVITRWRLAYDATLANRSVRVVREVRLTAVGSTTVIRPAWVDTARDRVQQRRE